MLSELYAYLKVIHMKLQDKLSVIDQSKLSFCSDEEFSTCKAIDICFPQATRVLCVRAQVIYTKYPENICSIRNLYFLTLTVTSTKLKLRRHELEGPTVNSSTYQYFVL